MAKFSTGIQTPPENIPGRDPKSQRRPRNRDLSLLPSRHRCEYLNQEPPRQGHIFEVFLVQHKEDSQGGRAALGLSMGPPGTLPYKVWPEEQHQGGFGVF